LFQIRYVIALRAYGYYAPKNDLSHTEDGRKMRAQENEKNPFQHMIVDNDEALEKAYYRALNDLMELMEKDEISQWIESEEYQKRKQLIVRKLKDFDDYFPISSLLLFHNLVPGLLKCQRKEIVPRITDAKFSALLDGTLEDTKLKELIKEACIYYALADRMPKLAVTMMPDHIVQKYFSDRSNIKGTKPPERNETLEAIQDFTKSYQQALNEIEIHVREVVSDDTPMYDFNNNSGKNFFTP